MERATPSRRTRSSAKQVNTKKNGDSGQSDESDQVNVTRRSKNRKYQNIHKANGENLSTEEDLNIDGTKTLNGGVKQNSKEHGLTKISQDLNDSENSNSSTISDKYSSSAPLEFSNLIPLGTTSKTSCEVDERKTPGPESEVRLKSECKENVLLAEKTSVDETGKNITESSYNVARSFEKKPEGNEEQSENSELGCDQNYDCSKQNDNYQTQEIVDVEKEAITNIDENSCIQELDSKQMVISDVPHQLDKTINNEESIDKTHETKHTSTKVLLMDASSQMVKSNEENCRPPEEQYTSNDSIEDTKQIDALASDISELTEKTNFEDPNTIQSTNGASGAARCKDEIFEQCPNEIFLDEHKIQVNVIENIAGNQEENDSCDRQKFKIDKLNKTTNFDESKQSVDVNIKLTNEDISNNVLSEEDAIDYQDKFTVIPSTAETSDICSVYVPSKKSEICDFEPKKNSSNLMTENMDVESETNIEAIDDDSFNANHKKFRRKNEVPDDLTYSEQTIHNQETPIELREGDMHHTDECSNNQIVIDDSSSSSSTALNENSNYNPSEDVDYSSDNLMNDIACNFGNKDCMTDKVDQCNKTDLDKVDQLKEMIDNECIIKDDECLDNVLDKNSSMAVEDIPPTKGIDKVDGNTIKIDNNYPNIDFDATENIKQEGDNNRSEVEISLKTLGDDSESNKTQIASLVNINANVKLIGGSLSVNEPTPEHMSIQEPTCFIEDEASTIITSVNEISEITASNSCSLSLTGALKPMAVVSEPQTLTQYEYDGFSANLRNEHSESNSDIYKDMSDLGSEKGEKKDGSLYDLESSSDPYFEPGESEEYVSSDHGEEEVDEEDIGEQNDEEEITKEENIELDQESDTGEEGKSKETPLTYDQALAILNKDRVKKIDDEEFFDMFTQELNRVSDAASGGSDSDIAIVDEYLMEPEEIEENKDTKGGKPQQMTPLQRSIPQKQNVPPSEHFQFTQPGPTQHGHQNVGMSKLGYPHDLYHQNNQNMPQIYPPVLAYDHYGQGPSNVPLMPGFNPQISTGIHYSRPPMYNHNMSSTGPKPYPQRSLIGLRIMGSQNQRTIVPRAMPGNIQQSGPSQYDPDAIVLNAANMEQGDKHDQQHNYGSEVSDDLNTPVLNLLGLNKEKLLMLKQVLGLDSNIDKINLRDTIISSMGSASKSKKKRNAQQRTNVRKKKQKSLKKNKTFAYKVALQLLFKSILHPNKILQNLSLENTSEDKTLSSSDDTLSSDDSHNRLALQDREVNLDSGQMFVTINTKGIDKHAHHQKKKSRRDSNCEISENTSLQMKHRKKVNNFSSKEKIIKHNCKKIGQLVQSDESFIGPEMEQKTRQLNRKRKFKECSDSPSSGSSGSEEPDNITKKMVKTRSGKETSPDKSYSVLKLNSGTFKVDLMEAFSDASGGSESPPQDDAAAYLEKMKRRIRNDIAAGKNKLSNMFTMVGPKQKMKRENSEDQIKKPKKLMKLPANILESLTHQEPRDRESADSEASQDSHHLIDRTKKKKRSRTIKVKSVAAKQGYIPLVTAGTSTQFNLQRLDSDDPLALAKSADDFRKERLYGSVNRRITSKELLNIKEKKKRSDFAAHRKKKS